MHLLIQYPLIGLFTAIALGLLLGNISIRGISLGSSGVIFSALGLGALGATCPPSVGALGLVLFVYTVGLSAGPAFFRAFASQGTQLAKLGLIITAVGALTAVLIAWWTGIPKELAAGLFAGAMTSTPALAAALDAVTDNAAVSVGYGVAYPFGVIGVVLFVQLLPRLLKRDLKAEAAAHASGRRRFERALVEVRNPSLFGKTVEEVPFFERSRCRLSRILEGEQLRPVTSELTLREGLRVMIVGEAVELETMIDFLGERSEAPFFIDVDTRLDVVVTSPDVIGQSLRDLNALKRHGVVISRVQRNGVEFIPNLDTQLLAGDVARAVGGSEHLNAFSEFVGHRTRALHETDLISVAVGLAVGLIVGLIPLALPGTKGFSLGTTGGPLVVGLILGHFGRIGRIRGYIPQAALLMAMELGLVLFLASAGMKAGGKLPEILATHGWILPVASIALVSAPMGAGYWFARRRLGMGFLQTLGGICGGMTSTPGLGAINSEVDSDAPAISYAAAYPVALILMTIFSQLIIRVISGF